MPEGGSRGQKSRLHIWMAATIDQRWHVEFREQAENTPSSRGGRRVDDDEVCLVACLLSCLVAISLCRCFALPSNKETWTYRGQDPGAGVRKWTGPEFFEADVEVLHLQLRCLLATEEKHPQ